MERENAALRGTNQALLFLPMKVHISSVEQFPDQIEKPFIVDFLAKRVD
jgi:hypothetical protein